MYSEDSLCMSTPTTPGPSSDDADLAAGHGIRTLPVQELCEAVTEKLNECREKKLQEAAAGVEGAQSHLSVPTAVRPADRQTPSPTQHEANVSADSRVQLSINRPTPSASFQLLRAPPPSPGDVLQEVPIEDTPEVPPETSEKTSSSTAQCCSHSDNKENQVVEEPCSSHPNTQQPPQQHPLTYQPPPYSFNAPMVGAAGVPNLPPTHPYPAVNSMMYQAGVLPMMVMPVHMPTAAPPPVQQVSTGTQPPQQTMVTQTQQAVVR